MCRLLDKISLEVCMCVCVSVSLTALCANSPCSRADTSQRLGCNYTPLSAPSLCPGEEKKEMERGRQTEDGRERRGGKAEIRRSWPVCIGLCYVSVVYVLTSRRCAPPQFCTHHQRVRHPKKKEKKTPLTLLTSLCTRQRFWLEIYPAVLLLAVCRHGNATNITVPAHKCSVCALSVKH